MFWFFEQHDKDTGLFFGAKKVWTYHSSFQEIVVLETESWGRVLVLDGLVQTTDRDAFIYHEMLVHVPLMSHPRPREVLIVGGGDGGTLREVLRHPVTRVVLCEIDPMVLEVVKRHWPEMEPVFDDPRVEVVARDGSQFLEEHAVRFDVIVVDSSDPVSHSRSLFQQTFLSRAAQRLHRPGIYVTQSLSPFRQAAFLRDLVRQLRTHFEGVHVYTAPVPSYPAGWWSFTLAVTDAALQPARPHPNHEASVRETRYYTPAVHQAAFVLPKYLQLELQ